MKAKQLRIHNFRSIGDAEIELRPYSLLVGPNNAGKSNVLAAIRMVYDDLKFSEARDFPKFPTTDDESWVEIEFDLDDVEQKSLKDEYLCNGGTLKLRKYLMTTDNDDQGKPRVGRIFAYGKDGLSASPFYGAKNVQEGKLGKVVYIPAVSKLDETTKMSGPSPLRDLVHGVLKTALDKTEAYKGLCAAFEEFNETVIGDGPKSDGSLKEVADRITEQLGDWGATFKLSVRAIRPDELLKSLVDHRLVEDDLGNAIDPASLGQGLQRHLVYSLIKVAAEATPKSTERKTPKKDFAPDLLWILFEEPEAFLHPPQADILDRGLRRFSNVTGQQVLITTHSTHFASRNLQELPRLVRLAKAEKRTWVGQVRDEELRKVILANQEIAKKVSEAGQKIDADDLEEEMEGIKYALWLDVSRASAFFARRVLLVEGPTERALIDRLLVEDKIECPTGGVAVLDTMGKWNTHRFMNLLGKLRVPHVVLCDRDTNGGMTPKLSEVFNGAIEDAKNDFTLAVKWFDTDIEAFLALDETQPHRKPQHVMYRYHEGKIDGDKIEKLCRLVSGLLNFDSV